MTKSVETPVAVDQKSTTEKETFDAVIKEAQAAPLVPLTDEHIRELVDKSSMKPGAKVVAQLGREIKALEAPYEEYNSDMQSTTPLLDIATQELLKALNDIKENVSDFETFTNTMVNGDKGIKLLEINSMQICLLATGEIADTPSPFDRNSVLTERKPEYISEKYGAKKCLDQLHKTMDRIVEHEIQVYKDNREVAKADPLSSDDILGMVGPSN